MTSALPYGPIAFTDVHYEDPGATAACVVAGSWTDEHAIEERVVRVASVAPYRPGAFFERELPCLLGAIGAIASAVQLVVVDGYVVLDDEGRPGLGAHLFDALGGRVPVVGVAKTSFRGSDFAVRVLRGTSRTPLFVTARGVDPEEAARAVRAMHGAHRIPTLLRRVDQLARGR